MIQDTNAPNDLLNLLNSVVETASDGISGVADDCLAFC